MELLEKILQKATPDNYSAYEDAFAFIRTTEKEQFKECHTANMELRDKIAVALKECNDEDIGRFYELYYKTLLFDAPHFFDAYLLYIEKNRKPKDKFYQPRRRILKPVADALQKLADDELDELFLSMPPRVGKTSLMMFFVTWIIGKRHEYPSLYCSYSDVITEAFYNGILEILRDKDTYLWKDVFPKVDLVRTNAKDEILDLGRQKHYPTLTCRSLYGTLNGSCDAEKGFIISDDLIGGIEEALNKERLNSSWSKVDNNLIPRGKSTTKYLWIGTRWSIYDPTGRRLDLVQNDPKYSDIRYEYINLPALNDNDESNFTYDYGVGFDTGYYHRRRASFERNNDTASWLAQYMGQPIEREGTLFNSNDMRYYNGELPDGEPDRTFMAIDPAFGGGDFVASPICYQYGEDIYVVGVVYSNANKKITIPMLANAIEKYGVSAVRIEATKTTEAYKEELEKQLKDKGIKINLTSKPAGTRMSKNDRIYDKAPEIRDDMVFLEDKYRDKAYSLFMTNVFAFQMEGKNLHDDAPDSLAMAIDMCRSAKRVATVFKRPF